VKEVCVYLKGRQILTEQSDQFHVTHDYVSDYMATAPDVPIDPTDRDNIRAFKFQARRDRTLSEFTRFVPPPTITLSRVLILTYLLLAVAGIIGGFVFQDLLLSMSRAAYETISDEPTFIGRWKRFLVATSLGQDPIWFSLGVNGLNYRAVVTVAIAAVQLSFMLYLDFLVRNLFHVANPKKRGVATGVQLEDEVAQREHERHRPQRHRGRTPPLRAGQ
jgi:hypothetical protein